MPYEFTHDQDNGSKPPVKKKRPFINARLHSLARFFSGLGLKKTSIKLYQKLVDKGDTDAMYILGKMYWWGYKIPRNPAKAVELIEYAAIRGNEDAIQFKEDMIADGIWRLGRNQDKFMDVFNERVAMEANLHKSSNYLLQFIIYVAILAVIVKFAF